MNSALAAMLGLTLSIILIVKKVSPVYSLILDFYRFDLTD